MSQGAATATAVPCAASAPSRRVLVSATVGVLALVGWFGVQRAVAFGASTTATTIVDFDVFHLVGRLALDHRLSDAYAAATLRRLEAGMSADAVRSIPFSYPPPFALAMAGLASLPTGAAYALFEVLGFAALAGALRRLSPFGFWPVMLATVPAVFINVIVGQNGMLTAGLAGIAASLALEGRGVAAGALAGLLAGLKPQSCAALPMVFVGRRDWRAPCAMAAAVAALVGLSLVSFGPAIVPQFLSALSETGALLAGGRFPLHRMTSAYACLRSLGASADLAMTVHAGVALAVLALVAGVARRRDARVGAGLTMIGACFVSPYFYDYDLPVAALGLAMARPVGDGGGRRATVVPLLLLALAESSGLVETLALPIRVSFGAPLLLACLLAALSCRADGAVEPAAVPRRPAMPAAA